MKPCPRLSSLKVRRVLCALALGLCAVCLLLSLNLTHHVTFEVQWSRDGMGNGHQDFRSTRGSVTRPPQQSTTWALPTPSAYYVVHHSGDLDKAGVAGLKRDKQDGAWYKMKQQSVELYTYSAHYDNRKSLLGKPVVRVIGVSELYQSDKYFCVVWFQNKTKIVRISATYSEIGGGVIRHDKVFTEFILSCPMFDYSLPTHVSIVFSLKMKPTFAMPIEIPNEAINKPVEEIGICVSLSYWYHDPGRLVEWIEFQRLMGVGGIHIYNNSLSEETLHVFKHYEEMEPHFLHMRQSHLFMKDRGELTFHMQMSPVINDCYYRNRLRYKSILVIDFDEYVIPHSTNDFPSMIRAIKREHSLSTDKSQTHQFSFRNAYFFFEFPPALRQPKEMVLMRYIRRADLSEMGYSAKSLVGVNSCIGMHNHYCWQHTRGVGEDMVNIIEVDPSIAFLHHYKKCHLNDEECEELFKQATTDQRTWHFEEDMKLAVSEKREELGMARLS